MLEIKISLKNQSKYGNTEKKKICELYDKLMEIIQTKYQREKD